MPTGLVFRASNSTYGTQLRAPVSKSGRFSPEITIKVALPVGMNTKSAKCCWWGRGA